jgi:hypothetical protein
LINALSGTCRSRRYGQIGIKNSLKIIVTGALLLAATSTMAGLLSSPMGVLYANPELAPVDIQNIGDDMVQIHSNGLAGEPHSRRERRASRAQSAAPGI